MVCGVINEDGKTDLLYSNGNLYAVEHVDQVVNNSLVPFFYNNQTLLLMEYNATLHTAGIITAQL